MINLPGFGTTQAEVRTIDETTTNTTKMLTTSHAKKLKELKEQKKVLRDQLTTIQKNDITLSTLEEPLKEARQKYSQRKKEVLSTLEANSVVEKIKEAQKEIKELEDFISEDLKQYVRETGQLSFQFEEEELPIIQTFRVKL